MLEYSHTDLRHVSMTGQDLRSFSFDGSLLDDVDLTRADLRGASFVGCNIKDLHLSLNCKTFEDVSIDAKMLKMLIFLISKMKVVDGELPTSVRIQIVEAMMEPATDYNTIIRLLIPVKEYFKIEEFTKDVDG